MVVAANRLVIVSPSPADRPDVARRAANHLTTFGGAAVHTAAGPITGRAAQRHRIALLALLSTTRRLYRSRDQLVFFLWPNADAERGRKLLSDSIYRVNQALGGDVITGSGDDLRLNRLQIDSDVADFESALDARDWRKVADLYAGPFLDGFFLPDAPEFEQWMENERGQYARCAAKAIESLAVDARDARRVAEAVDWWQRLAALDPDDSRVAMELMRALEASGNRSAALRHARTYAARVRESLGVEPDRSVQELADQIVKRSEAIAAPVTPIATLRSGADVGALEIADPTLGGASSPPVGGSIAVLPFKNLSATDPNAYFADGMSEELTYMLTRMPGLRVVSPTSALACRDLKLDVREVARRLQVEWILEGSVRRAGRKLRIVAQLTDARSGYQIWSESFDRTSSDIFAIQEEIAIAIANRIAPAVSGGVTMRASTRLDKRSVPDAETYDLYLQARFQWHRRTQLSLAKSTGLFEQVVARDPQYARAWSGLADAYAVQAFYAYLAPKTAFPRAESAARQAMELDATLAAPHATLAFVDTYYHWNWQSAENGFRRAIELEATNSTVRQWYAHLLAARGRFDEAEAQMRRASELDPLSMIAIAALGWVFILADENDRAIQQLGAALQLDGDFRLAHYWMGVAYLQKGQASQAIQCLERIREPLEECPQVLQALARANAMSGNEERTRVMLDELLARERTGRYISSYEVAKLHQVLGDIPAALARLEHAYTDRAHAMALLKIDPQMRPLAGENRFRRLVERVDGTH